MATERLSFDRSQPGGGTVNGFHRGLQLTQSGASRSVWSLPAAFHPSHTAAPMSGNALSSWSLEGERAILRSARIGQEFVVEANDGIKDWLRAILTERPATFR